VNDDLLDGLNPVQREAVLHGDGPLLVLAGAGSGKTRVVTARIARLLRSGVRPDQILAVTFTNKAAAEMRERVQHLVGGAALPSLTLSTFHAFGARFLRQHAEALGRTARFVIYDDDDQAKLVKKAMEIAGLPPSAPLAKAIRRAFDQARNRGHAAEQASLPEEEGTLAKVDLARVGVLYDELLTQADAFDFGDLIRGPAVVLEQDEYLRTAYQRRYRHVLVDEFQDTNQAQYRLLRALAPPGSNLVVVGDDDQSIYGWRGAEVDNILRFPDEWHGRLLRLEQNYRSEGHILEAANGVISFNKRRLGKSLWTEQAPGARVEVLAAEDAREEARRVVSRMLDLQGEGYEPGDMAVLYRANHLALDLEDALRRVRMPYVVVRGRAFYERAEVRDGIALLRLVVNPADDVALERTVEHVLKGVGTTSLAHLSAHARAQGTPMLAALPSALAAGVLKGRAKTGLAHLATLLEEARSQADVVEGVARLFTETGLMASDADLSLLQEDDRDRDENLRRILAALAEVRETGGDLAAFLEQVKLVADSDTSAEGGAVALMTVHAAKGLEFPAVFVIGLEEGTFPGTRSLAPEKIEEERRLFYVAVTRARRRLFLAHAERRRRFGDPSDWRRPSRFLGEVPASTVQGRVVRFAREAVEVQQRDDGLRVEREPDVGGWSRRAVAAQQPMEEDGGEGMHYRPGMKIWHADFGVGEVLRVRMGMEVRLDIRFAELGTRTVVARFVSPYEG